MKNNNPLFWQTVLITFLSAILKLKIISLHVVLTCTFLSLCMHCTKSYIFISYICYTKAHNAISLYLLYNSLHVIIFAPVILKVIVLLLCIWSLYCHQFVVVPKLTSLLLSVFYADAYIASGWYLVQKYTTDQLHCLSLFLCTN